MRKRGGNKLKYQVTKALKAIDKIGISKKDLRDKGMETGIHSTKQMEHALSTCQNFAEWLMSEKGVTDLYQLRRAHYREYIRYMQEKGVSVGHLINTETNLRLLQKGMHAVSRKKGFKPRVWCPRRRMIKSTMREKPVDRSITKQEYERVLEKLPESVRVGAELQYAFGLRLREVANTRAGHIVEDGGKLYWVAVPDRNAVNTAVGVTKAGRGRVAPCRPEMEARVREIIRDRAPESRLVPVTYNTLKSAYYRADLGGSHVFRHSYARDMLKAELKRLGVEKEGREIIRRMVANRQEGLRKDSGIRMHERELYRQVNQAIDTVHGYLGHGISRSDLMQVYMS